MTFGLKEIYSHLFGEIQVKAPRKKFIGKIKWFGYEWIGDDTDNDESYFEFIINQDDLTNDVSLTIVDFAEKDEIEETSNLWDTQISKLKHLLGS